MILTVPSNVMVFSLVMSLQPAVARLGPITRNDNPKYSLDTLLQ